MKVNLHVPKVEIVPVEVPDEMLTNIIFDNCKANWNKRPQTSCAPGRNDYEALVRYIFHNYQLHFVDDYEYAEVTTAKRTGISDRRPQLLWTGMITRFWQTTLANIMAMLL